MAPGISPSRLVRVSAACLGLVAAGCQPHVFHTEVKGQGTVEGSALGELLGTFPSLSGLTQMDFNENQDFQSEGVTKEQVSSVKVESVRLQITAPDDQDFDFLQRLELFARTGERETKVAEQDNIPALGLEPPRPVLSLQVRDVELRDYVTAPAMSVEVRGRGSQPPQDTALEATVRLRVEVKLF